MTQLSASFLLDSRPKFPDQFSVELCADELALGGLMTGVGGAPRIFHRRRRRGFMVGGGGVGDVRPDERALKHPTRWTGVFFWFYRGQPLHL